jgi:transcription initiation factor TFIID subunit 6
MVVSVPNVQAGARSTLVSLVEEHISSLVREAVCVQRHSKRARIHMQGDNDQSGLIRRRLHADDVNMALQWRGSEKIYATGTVGKESSENKKVNLEDYLKSEMDLRPPHEVGLTIHWLAVDGIQPDIPQNPGGQTKELKQTIQPSAEPEGGVTSGAGGGGVHVTQLLPRLLSEELRLYFTRVTTAMERGGATPTTRQQQDAALAGIARDPGLQEMVPFLILYVSKSLSHHLGNPEHCRTLVRIIVDESTLAFGTSCKHELKA